MKDTVLTLTPLLLVPLAMHHAAGHNVADFPVFRRHLVVLKVPKLKHRPYDDAMWTSVVSVAGRIANPLGKLHLCHGLYNPLGDRHEVRRERDRRVLRTRETGGNSRWGAFR